MLPFMHRYLLKYLRRLPPAGLRKSQRRRFRVLSIRVLACGKKSNMIRDMVYDTAWKLGLYFEVQACGVASKH